MGYRIYLAEIDKEKLSNIKKCNTFNELIKLFPEKNIDENDEDDWLGVYDIVDDTLHEFGKYVDFTIMLENDYGSKIFTSEELVNKYQDYDFFEINLEGLLYIIDEYRKDMLTYNNFYWAASQLMNILMNYKNTEDEKELYNCVYNIFASEDYNNWKYDLYVIYNGIVYEDLMKENYKEEISKDIKYIINKIITRFRIDIDEYQKIERTCNIDMENKKTITNSWNKDKCMLELVHIMKTFDFENKSLIIYGY